MPQTNSVLDAVLENTHMMAAYLDVNFNFIWVNSSYAAAGQQEPSFFPGKNHFTLYPNADNQAIFQRVVDTGEPFYILAKPFEYADQPERGITYWDWSLKAILNDAGKATGLVFTLVDVTARKRMEDEILKAQKLESLAILAGGLAHDFSNLLTSILGNISLARLNSDPGSVSHEILGAAERASFQAKGLAQQLLIFAKGGSSMRKVVKIADMVREYVTLAARGSAAKCHFDMDPSPVLVELDPAQFRQVIENLMNNAIQAMPTGGSVSLQTRNQIMPEGNSLSLKPGTYVHIEMRDSGAGIPAKDLNKIFDPFFTTKQTGSGLGLATCYSIIKKHDGHISAASELGTGTTLSIYLPVFVG